MDKKIYYCISMLFILLTKTGGIQIILQKVQKLEAAAALNDFILDHPSHPSPKKPLKVWDTKATRKEQ